MRLQLALNVKDLDAAVAFYSKMFGVSVNKRKPGYANFAVEQPLLKLVLFENPEADERLNHLGVEVFEAAEVTQATERLKSAGLAELVEDEATCCYATQNKVWAVEPDGARWEWYQVLEDSETFFEEWNVDTPHELVPVIDVEDQNACTFGAALLLGGIRGAEIEVPFGLGLSGRRRDDREEHRGERDEDAHKAS